MVMVLAVLGALALVGAPFVVSMMLHDRASQNFSGTIKARQAAESFRNRAVARLEATQSAVEWEGEYEELEEERELQRAGRRTSMVGRRSAAGGRTAQGSSRRQLSGVRGGTAGGAAAAERGLTLGLLPHLDYRSGDLLQVMHAVNNPALRSAPPRPTP